MKKQHKRKTLRRKPTREDFLQWFFQHNKRLILLFGMLITITLTVGNTFAWDLFEDKETNTFGDGKNKVSLKENFNPSDRWSPESMEVKEVFARNKGDYAAFVRISISEALMTFDVDTDKTGNLIQLTSQQSNQVKMDDLSTWQLTNSSYMPKNGNQIFQPISVFPNNVAATGQGFAYTLDNLSAREATDLKYISLLFGERVKENESTSALTDNYWLYGGDGYFYYSEALMPGKDTSFLLEKTVLSESTPNRLKGALYKIVIDMDARDISANTLVDWGHLTPGDEVYEMLKNKVE